MAKRIVECVSNFSEGRDERVVDAIVDAIAGTPGVVVLGRESDCDHHRSVVTFAGEPDAVAAAALRGIEQAVLRIDLSRHAGVHPRIGAADVVPLVPVEGVTLEECVRLAVRLGEEVWRLLRVPVYLYAAAARIPERQRLENLRRGGLPWLREHIAERPPDIGDPVLHPTAGAVVIGARKFLIAYNVNLTTGDVGVAKSIARAVRESNGGLPAVKAMGVRLESRGVAQVSMNLTDFERTGIGQAFQAVRIQAARHGVAIATSQIVGLVPRRAWESAAAVLTECENFRADRVLENRLEALAPPRPFDEVLDQISSPVSPMGGGSASAVAGALAAALGYMVARISKLECDHFLGQREFFASAVARDAEAFDAVSIAMKSDASVREEAMDRACRVAVQVPCEMTERAKELDRDLLALRKTALPKLHSDLTTALALSRAARAGAIAAAKANLESIKDVEFRREIEERLDRRPG